MILEPLDEDFGSAADGRVLVAAARFTLEQPGFAGQRFAARFRVCGNPCCPCGAVGFECRREGASDPALCFDLDVFDRQLNTRVATTPDGVALGRAFLAEAQDAQWEWLGRLFLNAKLQQMEDMDLDTLDVRLPDEVRRGNGTMVGYREIFPWAEHIGFEHEEDRWFVDDQYCVRPGCTCTETGLGFFRVNPALARSPEPLDCLVFLFIDYQTGKTRLKEAQPGSGPPDRLVQALRAAHPDLAETLRHRHAQLKRLGLRLLPKQKPRARRPQASSLWANGLEVDAPAATVPAATVSPALSVGRNDPCPCGSGKKYKKCCGAN